MPYESKVGALKLWEAMEFLSPPELPATGDRHDSASPCVIDIGELREPFPWEGGSRLDGEALPEAFAWHHEVIAYPFEMQPVRAKLEERFGVAPSAPESVRLPTASLFSFKVSDRGFIDAQGITLSTTAWLFARIDTAQDWRAEFEASQASLRAVAEKHLKGPLTSVEVARLSRWVMAHLGLELFFAKRRKNYRVISTPVPVGRSLRSPDPINSPYLADLMQVANAVIGGQAGAALGAYLCPGRQVHSVDVLEPVAESGVMASLFPAKYPHGCWPTLGHQDLNLSQQVALNYTVSTLSGAGGIIGIDAPAASGKIALFRDLVANAVTNRADALAKLPSTSAAFVPDCNETVVLNQDTLRPRQFVPGLLGHEVVIASSDLRMVRSIPYLMTSQSAVEPTLLSGYDRLGSLATDINGTPSWGMMCATVSPDESMDLLEGRLVAGPDSMCARLQESRASVLAPSDQKALWLRAVDRYKKAKAAAAELVNSASEIEAAQLELIKARAGLAVKRKQLAARFQEVNSTNEELQFLRKMACGKDFNSLTEAMSAKVSHEALRPNFVESIKTLWRADRKWLAEQGRLADVLAEATFRQSKIEDRLSHEEAALEQRLRLLNRLREDVAAAEHDVMRFENSVRDLAESYGAKYMSGWLAGNKVVFGTDLEKVEAWKIPGWRAARAMVFMEAMELQKTFLKLEASAVQSGLKLAVAMLKGDSFPHLSDMAKRSAWATMFMVMPAVSAKLNEFGQCFGSMGKEQIGWLIFDEAGKAKAPAAVGALWRAKRAISLGDGTNQPATDWVPHQFIVAQGRAAGADAALHSSEVSIQQLAAGCTRMGCLVGHAQKDVWLGIPLHIPHRHDHKLKACYPHVPIALKAMTAAS